MRTKKKPKNSDELCFCGTSLSYESCCQLLHEGKEKASSALQLMRSRYCAYAVGHEEYLLTTWSERTRPVSLNLESDTKWLRLKILKYSKGTNKDYEGTVEFIATYKQGGKAHRLREESKFLIENGRWVYLDGITNTD